MKSLVYVVLLFFFIVVIYQFNSLFNVNDKLAQKVGARNGREKSRQEKAIQELKKQSNNAQMATENKKIEITKRLDESLKSSEYEKIRKFSKKYFSQVGRNYRVFYMKDERMIYLQRMWFDQMRKPFEVIRADFPSIYEHEGCCFVAEPDFFIVIPDTNIYKKIGPFKFDR